MAGWMKLLLGMVVGLSPGDFMETHSSLHNKGGGATSQFLSHFYCAQTARCIKMPLSMEVGLSPGEFVLDGDPVPSPKRDASPILRV